MVTVTVVAAGGVWNPQLAFLAGETEGHVGPVAEKRGSGQTLWTARPAPGPLHQGWRPLPLLRPKSHLAHRVTVHVVPSPDLL